METLITTYSVSLPTTKLECRNRNTNNTFPFLAVKLETTNKLANLPTNHRNHQQTIQTTHKPAKLLTNYPQTTHEPGKYLTKQPVISKNFPDSFHEKIFYN